MILAYSLALCLAPMLYGMEGKLSVGSSTIPLTCQLDAELFESLLFHLTHIVSSGKEKSLTSIPIYGVSCDLRETIAGYGAHRTLLMGSAAVAIIADVLNSFYQLDALDVESAAECRSTKELAGRWDLLAQKVVFERVESRTVLKCAGLFDDPELFLAANKTLEKKSVVDPLHAAVLGVYCLKQMNRLRIHSLSKIGAIALSNANF